MWSSVRALLFLRNVEFNQNQRRRMDVFLKQENLPGWGRNVDWELLVWPLELALIRSSYKLVHVYTFWRFPLFYGWIRVTIDTLFFESTRNNKSERPRTVIICLFRHLGVISTVPQRASLNLSFYVPTTQGLQVILRTGTSYSDRNNMLWYNIHIRCPGFSGSDLVVLGTIAGGRLTKAAS